MADVDFYLAYLAALLGVAVFWTLIMVKLADIAERFVSALADIAERSVSALIRRVKN